MCGEDRETLLPVSRERIAAGWVSAARWTALVAWTYTDLALPVWEPPRDFIGIDTRRAKAAQKLGITNYPGWSAYWLEGTTFVKAARVVRGARYPDLGCCWETFTNGKMIEF